MRVCKWGCQEEVQLRENEEISVQKWGDQLCKSGEIIMLR